MVSLKNPVQTNRSPHDYDNHDACWSHDYSDYKMADSPSLKFHRFLYLKQQWIPLAHEIFQLVLSARDKQHTEYDDQSTTLNHGLLAVFLIAPHRRSHCPIDLLILLSY